MLYLCTDSAVTLQAPAFALAESTGEPVQHPLLDKVRQVSTNPEVAADFFTKMLHPDPEKRMSIRAACQHPYVCEAVQLLESEIQDSASESMASDSTASSTPTSSASDATEACSGSTSYPVVESPAVNSPSLKSEAMFSPQPAQGAPAVIGIVADCRRLPADAAPAVDTEQDQADLDNRYFAA